MTAILRFLRDDRGQDLIEYTLLIAFIALASASLFLNAGGSVSGIWAAANKALVVTNSCTPYATFPNGTCDN